MSCVSLPGQLTVQIVYWAHSYRQEDAAINKHFGILIEQAAHMIVNFDPPSEKVNASKLEQNLRSCDGMIGVLTWRPSGPSQYILYEIGLALRARKPLLVFVDDRLPGDVIPPRILQRRFSHRTYFRQVREHTHALRELITYMGDPPVPRYQPSSNQRACATVGLRGLKTNVRTDVSDFVQERGYHPVDLDGLTAENPLLFATFEKLADVAVCVRCVDGRTSGSHYWSGALSAAAIPAITFSLDPSFALSDALPKDFQPRVVDVNISPLRAVIGDEFDLFEQDFLKVQDPAAIERYTMMQVQAGDLRGRYEVDTRRQYVEVIMGDQYNISGQAGAVGPQAHAHDMTFNQIWQQLQGSVDLNRLAAELRELHDAMERDSVEPSHRLASGAVAAAEQSARQGDGPKALEYLKSSGKWALSVAQKIGVDVAAAVIKQSLGV
jgi:hypothetical protein